MSLKKNKHSHSRAGVSGLIAAKVLEENGYFPNVN